MAGSGAQQLAAVSAFGGRERLRLPFDLQRSQLFLLLIGLATMAIVAVATGLRLELGIGLAAAVALAFAVALNEMVGLVLLASLAAATSGLAKGVPVPGVRVSEALIGGVGLVLLISARRFVRWAPLDWLALAYCVGTLVLGGLDMIQLGQPFGLGTVELLLGPFQFFLLYRATVVVARTPERRRLALRLMLFASVPVSLLAIGQQLNFPGTRSLLATLTHKVAYGGGTSGRVTGPFPLWHNLGGYLVLLLLALLTLYVRRIEGVMSRRAMLVVGALDLIALVETLDLGPILALIAGAIIIGVWLGGLNRVLLALAGVIVVALVLFGSRVDARLASEFSRAPGTDRSVLVPQTVQYRFDLWTGQLLPLLKGHVLTGYGPNLPPALANFPYTESQYINFLYRGGASLLGIWALMFVAMGLAGARAARDADPMQRALGVALATSIICLAFMQLLEAFFVDDGTPQVLWMLLGLLAFHEIPGRRGLARPPAFEHPMTRRAWASNVAMAFDTIDPGSRQLLQLGFGQQLSPAELVSVIGLNEDAVCRWESTAVERLAANASMSRDQVEDVLRSQSFWTDPAAQVIPGGPPAPEALRSQT